MKDIVERTRDRIDVICRSRMKRRVLKNGIVVHYIFEHLFKMPHFTYYSEHLSGTGYRSDFFGSYGVKLSDEEVLEAFDIRANIWYEKRQRELNKASGSRRSGVQSAEQLVLAI